jgi:hypothetical protein
MAMNTYTKVRTIFFLGVLFFFLSKCSEKRNPITNEISVEINANNQYLVNGKSVPTEKLKEVLLMEKEILTKLYKEDEISIVLRVDEDAKRGALADLEVVLRQLNLRKIKYIKNPIILSCQENATHFKQAANSITQPKLT